MKRLFIDMDDTLCDFSGAKKEALEKEPGIEWPQSQFDFFRTLKPLPGAVETFKKLEEYYEVHVLSRPSAENMLCFTEKAVWVRDHLGQEVLSEQRFHLSGRKDYFAETGDAILIDDYDWKGFKGEQIKFGSDKFPDWATVWEYLSPGFSNIKSIVCNYTGCENDEVIFCFEASDIAQTDACYGNICIDGTGKFKDYSDIQDWDDIKGFSIENIMFVSNDETSATVTFENSDEVSDPEEAFFRAFKDKLKQ